MPSSSACDPDIRLIEGDPGTVGQLPPEISGQRHERVYAVHDVEAVISTTEVGGDTEALAWTEHDERFVLLAGRFRA